MGSYQQDGIWFSGDGSVHDHVWHFHGSRYACVGCPERGRTYAETEQLDDVQQRAKETRQAETQLNER